ncbi:hypothetical protein [Nocardia sp. NRRL S-836]|uniref:hypothetical protein n=1 Tax=Nocardia sp. NRRL S-836 TaxID=1519492 RepID=UPI0006AF8BD2|nr:hypothetical protein [Nocardia sp. NRRL S-836]
MAHNGSRYAVVGLSGLLAMMVALLSGSVQTSTPRQVAAPEQEQQGDGLLARGRYLATIGVCEACHTPPAVPETPPDPSDVEQVKREREFRTDPDWKKYLDETRRNAGGVPFILRLSATSSGVVYSRNITPDLETGIGSWSEDDIVRALRTGVTPDGRVLFLFAPHTFFANMADSDAKALAKYLKSLPPVRHRVPDRELPFPPQPAPEVPHPKDPPRGRTPERAEYLLAAVVGCKECHSHHENGQLQEFTGGDPKDAFVGVFRLGPDLPLRAQERGFAAFPYPGYAVLYGGNLTRFGKDGPNSDVPVPRLVRAIRQGIAVEPDEYGRPRPLEHVMLWQFYAQMSDDDAYSIAQLVKRLRYVPHDVHKGPIRFGEDWRAAFQQVFGEPPSPNDERIFGKGNR